MSQTNFAQQPNNVSARVGSAGYTAASGKLTLATGDGAKFPTLTGSQWLRVSVVRAAVAYSPTSDPAGDLTVFKVTAVTGDDLTIAGVLEGTTDRDYAAGDVVECRLTGGELVDLQTAVNALEALSFVVTTTTYANPSWLGSIDGSKITGAGSIDESLVSGLTGDLAARPTAAGNETIGGSWSFSAATTVLGNMTVARGSGPDWSLGSDASTQVRYDSASGQTIIASFGDRGRVVVGYDSITSACRVGIDTTNSRTTLGIVGTLGFQATTDTTADRQQAYWSPSWVNNTDADRLGRMDEYTTDWTGTGKLVRRIESDGSNPRSYQCAPPAAPVDASIPTSMLTLSVDETGNTLNVRVRYSDGTTLKSGSVPLS